MIKLLYVISTALLMLFFSCTSPSTSTNLPGKYYRQGKFASASFTEVLTIRQDQGQSENIFMVESSSTTIRLDDNDKPLPAIQEQGSSLAIYHPDKKLLGIIQKGIYYVVDFKKGVLINGEGTYRKRWH